MSAASCIAPAAWLVAILALLITISLVAITAILYLAHQRRQQSYREYIGRHTPGERRYWPVTARRRAGMAPLDPEFSFPVFDRTQRPTGTEIQP
jgi:hypothetical protein